MSVYYSIGMVFKQMTATCRRGYCGLLCVCYRCLVIFFTLPEEEFVWQGGRDWETVIEFQIFFIAGQSFTSQRIPSVFYSCTNALLCIKKRHQKHLVDRVDLKKPIKKKKKDRNIWLIASTSKSCLASIRADLRGRNVVAK